MGKSIKTSTLSALKRPIQEVIYELNQQASNDGYKEKENNFKYIISQVEENWVIVLLVFIPGQKEPKEYIETIANE